VRKLQFNMCRAATKMQTKSAFGWFFVCVLMHFLCPQNANTSRFERQSERNQSIAHTTRWRMNNSNKIKETLHVTNGEMKYLCTRTHAIYMHLLFPIYKHILYILTLPPHLFQRAGKSWGKKRKRALKSRAYVYI